MRYRANKKVSLWCWRHQDLHQKQYVPLPFGWGHKYQPMSWEIRENLSLEIEDQVKVQQACSATEARASKFRI